MQSIEIVSNQENKLKENLRKQGYRLVNVRFIDEETSFYVTEKIVRKKEK